MSFLTNLFKRTPDPRESTRALWHRVVEISREEPWYAQAGVSDSVAGRFDMITAVLCLTLIRMERSDAMAQEIAWLTELFVEDMDGQLREFGINDVVVGKHVGRLMSVLGGRLGAYRNALAQDDDAALVAAADRNMLLVEGARPEDVATGLRELAGDLAATSDEDVLAGAIAR